jgi:hypothetical protein
MSTNSSTLTVQSNQADSLNNGLLFQPVQTSSDEPFFLSPPPSSSSSAHNEFSLPTGKTMQTSTLIISTPPQYHYYLYPPSSTSRKHAINNRTVSNVSINSVSTNSSSSHTSYESPILDIDDEAFSSSTYSTSQPRIYPKQFTGQPTFNHWKLQALLEPKPVILSDSVQAFWPPPPPPRPPPPSTFALNSDPEQTRTVSAAEQVSSLVHLTVRFLFQFCIEQISSARLSSRNVNFCSRPSASIHNAELKSFNEEKKITPRICSSIRF